MNPSVRVVCTGCLRSVELRSDATRSAASRCPHCGGSVDSKSSQIERSGEDAHDQPIAAGERDNEILETTDWVGAGRVAHWGRWVGFNCANGWEMGASVRSSGRTIRDLTAMWR